MRWFNAAVLSLGLLIGSAHAAAEVSVGASVKAPEGEVNLSFFYESLSPHGKWHNDAMFGWVWQPSVVVTEREWRPYRDHGHWVWTNLGWYWESTYDWGWAPFHYGRWTFVDNLSWVWVPDVVWAPSWVVWRHSHDAYGWAPLPPGVEVGANIDVNINIDMNFYTFVRPRSFLSANIETVALPQAEVRTVFQQTKIVNNSYTVQNNNTVINNGIPVQQVAQSTGQQIKPVEVTNAEVKAGQPIPQARAADGKLAVYRPAVKKEAPEDPNAVMKRTGSASKQTDAKTGAATSTDANKTGTDTAKTGTDASKSGAVNTTADQNKSATGADARKTQEAAKPATGDRKANDQSMSKPAPGQVKKDADSTSAQRDANIQSKDESKARSDTSFERNPNAATPAQPAEPQRAGRPAQPAQPAQPSGKSRADTIKPDNTAGKSTSAPSRTNDARNGASNAAPRSNAPEKAPSAKSEPEGRTPMSTGTEAKEVPARDNKQSRSDVQSPGKSPAAEPKEQPRNRNER